MIDFVTDKIEFGKLKARFLSLFNSEKGFSENPFNSTFKFYLAFEYDFQFNKLFFEGLIKFLAKTEIDKFTFYTIEPSPEEYFYNYFSKFSVFEAPITCEYSDKSEIMMRDPGDSPADALAVNSNEIALFSASNEWAILGSRDWEIAIVGFASLEIKEMFSKSFGDNIDMFKTIKEQVEIYDEMFGFNSEQLIDYYQLIKNYNY